MPVNEEIIRLEEVYKIFGPQPRGRAFDLARSGVHKNEVQKQSGHVVGLSDVTFSIAKGEIFVVMGLSGSGKSTAIRTVNKLHEVTHGHVWVDGVDVQTLEGKSLQAFRREKMGMVFQHFALFPHRNVIENVAYGLKVQKVAREEREAAALRALQLVGLEAYAYNATSELSGGMQQRVGLARALASDPDILLMDEAFSALDPLIRRQMQDELMAIQDEVHKTILFITHDLNEALRIGDRVCIMKDGVIVQIGTPEEILTEPATGYVAEFVQDVDQGRVIKVEEIMTEPDPIRSNAEFDEVRKAVATRAEVLVIDPAGACCGLVTRGDVERVSTQGTPSLASAMRTDVPVATGDQSLNEIYAEAGKGLPIAVLDGDGRLIGRVEPTDVLEELGRVEALTDAFEREVYM
ncbi:MAG: glycine betaine/L-proline ABC transporter ATP-binding protein [Acidimicrobiales bacterium]|mgnify:FL=1|jgi:glycine betaine/proline transport system ATP-binding protein|nr:glycine betaine/L-proline ABC transporter ATP-binding protein [Acidimicrobiales bacterium]|tara:strand:- start:755 stop:1975 length:1221 start_codon:yes stop_codon:yes gene_type:complete